MSTLRTRIVASITAVLNKSIGTTTAPGIAPNVLAACTAPALDPVVFDWANGTSSGQASKAVAIEQSVNAGGFATLSLASMVDAYGDAVAFTKVKAFQLHIVSAPAAVVNVTDTFNMLSTSDSTAMRLLVAGDVALIARPAGITVGGGNNSITIGAVGTGTVTVRILIVGD